MPQLGASLGQFGRSRNGAPFIYKCKLNTIRKHYTERLNRAEGAAKFYSIDLSCQSCTATNYLAGCVLVVEMVAYLLVPVV